MNFGRNGVDRESLFALVVYIPDPLGKFLDKLRKDLVPECDPHAHVSVLPPRTLQVEPEKACDEIRRHAEKFPPFEIALGPVRKFTGTDVIYLEVEKGAEQLQAMHARMAAGPLRFNEPYVYHPHVTLAQGIKPEKVEELFAAATEAWKQYRDAPRFRAERAVFVRNSTGQCWEDLAELELGVIRVGS